MLSSCDGMLRIVDLEKGAVTDSFPVGTYLASSPAVVDGRYYIASLKGSVPAGTSGPKRRSGP